MPEGHTVHRNAAELTRRFGGRPVHASTLQPRFEAGAVRLDGQVVERARAHGKHLFVDIAGTCLHVHLGLYGGWRTGDGAPPPPRGALRLRLVGEGGWADLRGPTACELLDPEEVARLHARLGADPLGPGAAAAGREAGERVRRSRSSLAVLMMRQDLVAGIGNVYRAEMLFRAGLDPELPGRELREDEWDGLWTDLVGLMRAGVRAGRIVTTEPVDRDRRSGRVRREDATYVYRRTGLPCRICSTRIITRAVAGRNLFWCPTCQRPGRAERVVRPTRTGQAR